MNELNKIEISDEKRENIIEFDLEQAEDILNKEFHRKIENKEDWNDFEKAWLLVLREELWFKGKSEEYEDFINFLIGFISTMPQYSNKHLLEVKEILMKKFNDFKNKENRDE